MINSIAKFFIIILFAAFTDFAYSASASCSAVNVQTKQFFSATAQGSTQTDATENAKNIVLQNCEQVSDTTGCEVERCNSFQY